MTSLPTGTVTLVLADVENSTALAQTAGDDFATIIGRLRRAARRLVEQHAGQVVDTTGDEILAVFDDAPAAVETARQAQLALCDAHWPGNLPVRVRVGVHTGTPSLDDEGYVGIDLIRTSRIANAGHGGQVLLSASTTALVPYVETRDLGVHQLVGLADPEPIHQLLGDGLPRDFPPLRNTISQLGGGRRVVIAEDSVLLREGLVRLLEESGFDVVAQSGTADDLLRHVAMHHPDVAIVDIRMPPTHTNEGLVAAREIRERHAGTGVLVLSQYVETTYALDLLGETPDGVGYLLKDRVGDVDEFATSVRRVADGGSALDPEVVAALLGRSRRHDPLDELSPREREVLDLMAEGRSNQAIADRLFVTPRAVEKHVTSIFTKLGLPASADDHRRVLAVLTYVRD